MDGATGYGSYESGAREEAGPREGPDRGGKSVRHTEKNKAGFLNKKKLLGGSVDASCCAMMLLDLGATIPMLEKISLALCCPSLLR